jgi:hypothetical protein
LLFINNRAHIFLENKEIGILIQEMLKVDGTFVAHTVNMIKSPNAKIRQKVPGTGGISLEKVPVNIFGYNVKRRGY